MLNNSFAADPTARDVTAARGAEVGSSAPADTDPRLADAAGSDRYGDATRAVSDLRRGAAVIVLDDGAALACAAAETVDAARLDDLLGWSGSPPVLLQPVAQAGLVGLSGLRAAALPPAALTPAALRALADPTLGHPSDPRPESDAGPAGPPPPAALAAILLAKLAHLLPTLVGAPVAPDGVARARADGAVVVSASDILALRAAGRRLVRVGEAAVPLEDAANARVVAFRNPESGVEHIAVVIGEPERAKPSAPAPLVRLHSECFTGDVLGSLRCDCGPQLRAAMRRMAEDGAGVVLYLAQEGRGIGLLNKLRSYVLQDRGLDTLDANAALGWEADERDFSLAAAMLRDLGLSRVRLMTNNPAKLVGLAAGGLTVERASLLIAPNGVNDGYLATKAARFGHLLG